MHQDEPRWGEAPMGELIAELLVERFPIEKGERIEIEVDEPGQGIGLILHARRHRYDLRVDYLRGAGERDPWLLLVDALDNLFGRFIESNRAYRELPSGDDVEFEGAFLRVKVAHEIPEMERMANQILKSGGHSEEE